MALTVKQLRDFLCMYNDDAIVMTQEAEDIVHISSGGDFVIISPIKPKAICNRTGEYVFDVSYGGYDGVCTATNENLWSWEYTEIEK